MSSIFSTTIWLNITSIFAILYAIYLCRKSDTKLLKGSGINIISIAIDAEKKDIEELGEKIKRLDGITASIVYSDI